MNPDDSVSKSISMFATESADLCIRTTQPDVVADSMSKFGTSTNTYDTLKRDRLALAMYSMELEWRDHPVAMIHRLILTNVKLGIWLFTTFCLSTLILAPFIRLYGGGILSAVTYPVISFVCGLAAFFRFITTSSVTSAVRWFVVPQLAAILIEWSFSPAINPWWTAAPVSLAIAGVGCLADRVNTHYLRWITANLNLKRDAVLRRRRLWDLRFNWFALSEEISDLQDEIESLEAEGESESAFILRKRANELRELRQYPFGFFALIYMAGLLFAGAPSTMLLLSGFGVSVVLALRRPVMTVKLRRLIAEVNIHSFVSWFSWDPKQPWVHSPGMFHDRITSRYRRLTQTVLCFLLIDIAFVPPIHLWGVGEMLTPVWLWTSAYHFFLHLLLPTFFLLSALIATGARPLWMHLAAIEWTEESDELE
jgi:hypothetical protein